MRRSLTQFSIACLFACFFTLTSCSKKSTSGPATTDVYDPQGIYGTTTTFAGAVSFNGPTNGIGPAASFYLPTGLVVDATGNVYVADAGNNMIRKISPVGLVSTLAGSPIKGSQDGTGTAAGFQYPAAVAIDASGNVYVADQGNNLIRKVTSAGVVTTLAGSGSVGSANGLGTAASFYDVIGVAVDASGNVYVSDQGNNLIRKITPAGAVSTFAGSGASGSADGTGTAASFNTPAGITIDGSGNLYVADEFNQKIRKITPAGVVTTIAGTGAVGSANGAAATATFNYPTGVAIDANGAIYVADHSNNKIRAISSTGNVTTFAGTGVFGPQNGLFTACTFGSPTGVAVDPTTGNVFVADNANNLIRKLTTKQ
ncbi:MAG: NHL repeat-containing protein [Sphingobacteriales bacterium]